MQFGNIELLQNPSIAIVGSRDASEYGKKFAAQFASIIAHSNITVVSGLALGIDATAHENSIDEVGKTIAVMGSGFNNIFPKENENLFKDPLVIKVGEELAKNKNTVGDFSQTKTITQSGRKLKSIGKFIISDMGIVWKTEKPFASTLVISENKMVQTSASGKKTVMDGTDNQIFQSISSVLSSLFMGNTEKLYENFKIVVKNSDFAAWNIELSPKNQNIASVMKTFTLSGTLNSSENQTSQPANAILESLEIIENSGNTIKYEFSNQTYPQELTNDEKQLFAID